MLKTYLTIDNCCMYYSADRREEKRREEKRREEKRREEKRREEKRREEKGPKGEGCFWGPSQTDMKASWTFPFCCTASTKVLSHVKLNLEPLPPNHL